MEEGELPQSPDPNCSVNYDLINMEIDSPGGENPDASDGEDEAERLRRILLSQMKKKRSNNMLKSRQKSAYTDNNRRTGTTKLQEPSVTNQLTPPSFRPPLSPPGFSTPAPPPLPPMFSATSSMDQPDYASSAYQTLICSNSVEIADSPKSPINILESIDLTPDDSEDELAYEIDLDNAKKDARNRRREIERLFRKQRTNEQEYHSLRTLIEKTKKELVGMELKLSHHTEKGIELNERIKSHFEKYITVDSERLGKISIERARWKVKLAQRSARSKDRIKHLRESAALLMSQPYLRPKVIPLNPIEATTPIIPDFAANTSSKATRYKNRLSADSAPKTYITDQQKMVSTSARQSASHQPSPNERRRKSRSKESNITKACNAMDKLANQLNIAQIVGDGKTNAQAEAELFTRMLERTKKKQQLKSEDVDGQEKNQSNSWISNDAKHFGDNRRDEDPVEDPVQHQQVMSSEALAASYLNQLEHNVNQPVCSRFASLQEAVQSPLINFRSYRLSPSFPFEHINKLALANRMNSTVPLCPFELHGICADPTCKWQHDRDLNVSEHQIVKEILDIWPSLCPPNITTNELAKKLLQMNTVTSVARMLSAAVPKDIREQCFSDELKKLIETPSANVVN